MKKEIEETEYQMYKRQLTEMANNSAKSYTELELSHQKLKEAFEELLKQASVLISHPSSKELLISQWRTKAGLSNKG